MSVSMAIVDFFPVCCFLAAAILLQRDLYNKMSKGAFALFSAGTIIVVMAGTFKATWKLLYCLGICDFEVLNKCFFPMQTTGFVLAAVAMLAMNFHDQGKNAMYAVAVPPVFSGTIIFVVLMVLGVAIFEFSLCRIAKKMKKTGAVLAFVLSFILIMGMGYLSTKDFELAYMNWIAEAVNTFGQGALLFGVILLHKAGLAEWEG